MTTRSKTIAAGAAIVLALLLFSSWAGSPTIEVRSGDDLQAELDAAPAGAVVVLAAGTHRGGVQVTRDITLRGEPGATIQTGPGDPAVLTLLANGAAVEDLAVTGGATGVVVRDAERVEVRRVDVSGADLHGIEVIDASASISDVRVTDLRHPMAQGIEIRNSDGRPDSVVEDSVVVGGQEGIVSHVSEVRVHRNEVRDTTMRGITITEMSDGVVDSNHVDGATGAGLYCGDMSRCQFTDNVVAEAAPGTAGRSTEGWGLVVTYHAVASSEGDKLMGARGPFLASIGGHLRADSPLDPRSTASGLLPIVLATFAAVGLLLFVSSAVRHPARMLGRRPVRAPALIKRAGVVPLVLGGLAVQTFHMAEHTLQVFRVRIDQIPSRGGIVGPRVEAEWIHFVYNGAVFAAVALIVLARSRGWTPPGRVATGDRLLIAALLVQGYHVVEHTAKLLQHLQGGAKVNPGLAGGVVDLVLLHFAINLAVYLAMVGAALVYGAPSLRAMGRRTPRLAPARPLGEL